VSVWTRGTVPVRASRPPTRGIAAAACVLVALLAGCQPTCKEVCKKVLECDLDSDRVSVVECEENCTRQQLLYEIWEDEAKADLFVEHKQCIMGASCDEIADGTCYDEDLFVF